MRALAVARVVGSAALAAGSLGACMPTAGSSSAPAPRMAAAPVDSGTFMIRLGTDTLGVEHFVRSGDRLGGELLSRLPRTQWTAYTATLAPDGSVKHLELTRYSGPTSSSAVGQRTVVDFAGDSAVVSTTRRDSTRRQVVHARAGTLPELGMFYSLSSLAAMRARAANRDTVTLSMLSIGDTTAQSVVYRRVGRDSLAWMAMGEDEITAQVDEGGRVIGLVAPPTSTFKVTVTRVQGVDLAALARDFAQRDAAGQALGSLSPMDSVTSTLGPAHLRVVYSRPARRGRTIFPNVVPWNQVWRTGANEATLLSTDRDLVIGGTPVPAGSYTLFTIPASSGWKLIISRETGQWGTNYHPDKDLARVDMTTDVLPSPVDRFTIRVDPTGAPGAGALRMSWDTLQASVPITVKQ